MNTKIIVYFGMCVIWVIGTVHAAEAPGASAARSPIGSPTQVPSANRTGAIPTQPNVYGYVGNLTMTGNIGGGKHFRGFVPYGSMYYFDSGLNDPGSRAVSSFIRRSTGYEPYYDPTQTVSSLQRGLGSGLSTPTVPVQGGSSDSASRQWLNSFDLTELLKPQEQRPLAASPKSVEAILDQQISQDLLKKKETPAKETVEPVVPGLDITTPPVLPELPKVPEAVEKTSDREQKPDTEGLTIYEKIQQDLKNASQADLSSEPKDETTGQTETTQTQEAQEPQEFNPASPTSSAVTKPEDLVNPAMGRVILKNYPDFNHLAAAKSANYLSAGESFLKQGEFYKAADAFELASVWDPKNALIVLARSHALFAAGEYMSSALYLSQALGMEPKLIEARVDWSTLLGSRDVFDNRLVELSTWQQRSNSPELAFLGAYVLYLDDKVGRAQVLSEIALEHMPDDPAVVSLQKAVDKTLHPQPASDGNSVNP